MAKTLNFTSAPKRYLTVILADEENTKLLVSMPTRAVMRQFFTIQEQLSGVEGADVSVDLMGDLYAVCAAALSRNKAGVQIEPETLEELFGLDDIMLFFDAYLDFVGEAAASKN